MQIFEEVFQSTQKKESDRVILFLSPKEAKQLYEMSKAMTKAFPRRKLWKTWHKNFYDNLPF